jgi:nucleotide-binding universal stress UspA family protein
MKIRKLLLCTDFSAPASLLPDCLPELKERGLEEVILIHVVNIRSAGGNAAVLQKHNLQALSELKTDLEKQGFRASIRVPIGFPPHEIVDAANEEDVSLILLGAIGKGIIRRIFMGSTAFDVIRMSNKPVLIERFQEDENQLMQVACRQKFARVLIPIDFSAHSLSVLDRVQDLAGHGGNLILVHVIEGSDSETARQERIRAAEDSLGLLKKDLEERGMSVDMHIREGAASTHIIQIAQQEEATMIAIAKRGTGNIQGLLIGSTAEAVALRASASVLLFPAD